MSSTSSLSSGSSSSSNLSHTPNLLGSSSSPSLSAPSANACQGIERGGICRCGSVARNGHTYLCIVYLLVQFRGGRTSLCDYQMRKKPGIRSNLIAQWYGYSAGIGPDSLGMDDRVPKLGCHEKMVRDYLVPHLTSKIEFSNLSQARVKRNRVKPGPEPGSRAYRNLKPDPEPDLSPTSVPRAVRERRAAKFLDGTLVVLAPKVTRAQQQKKQNEPSESALLARAGKKRPAAAEPAVGPSKSKKCVSCKYHRAALIEYGQEEDQVGYV
ncbi:hypothetical protein DFH09DRAFT_1287590 [Mycena vulgaris]|nr:hypothetical protein DFH09DRAFT_1287590 [Mycena vulgaris]